MTTRESLLLARDSRAAVVESPLTLVFAHSIPCRGRNTDGQSGGVTLRFRIDQHTAILSATSIQTQKY